MNAQAPPERGWLEKRDEATRLATVTESYMSRYLCATPLLMERPVLFGIQWVNNESSVGKTKLPSVNTLTMASFRLDYDDNKYPLLSLSAKNIHKFLSLDIEQADFNYAECKLYPPESPIDRMSEELMTNFFSFCRDFIKLIRPPQIIVLGSANIMKLLEITSEFVGEAVIVSGELVGFKGSLWGFPFYSVPHPQNSMSSRLRSDIWEMIFSL